MSLSLSPLQKFIIRNSDLLSSEELAAYLEESPVTIQKWQEALGLPQMSLPDRERAFPIILRRNHDLLSHEEIARLLGMPTDVYRSTMLDMDFLDVKLGPKPDEIADIKQGRENLEEASRAFSARSREYFGNHAQWVRPFDFLDTLFHIEDSASFEFDKAGSASIGLRVMYSYTGSHGDFLLTGEDFYNEGILSRLHNRNVNAGWMPALLRDLAPSSTFPQFGKGHQIRIENLRRQVEKALKYGIRIYLYWNEPRFCEASLFEKYPESRGMPAHQAGYYGMCTSDSRVREWLYESASFVFSQVPDLGGVFIISASENATCCYSHSPIWDSWGFRYGCESDEEPQLDKKAMCPKCEKRGTKEVLADAANIVYQAKLDTGSDAEVMQYLWAWDHIMPLEMVEEAVSSVDPGIGIMFDWAKNTRYDLFGKTGVVDEYTMAHAEPSDYALSIVKAAREHGNKLIAKSLMVTTTEMGALPYLPAMGNVEVLLKGLQEHGIEALKGCWLFGSYPGRNMEMLNYLGGDSPARSLAEKYYGCSANQALEAWRLFSDGMKFMPTNVCVLYSSALTAGPGLRFSLEPEPWRNGMMAMATERLQDVALPFGPEIMIKGFRAVAKHFDQGLTHLRQAVDQSDVHEYEEENRRDYGICKACMLHLRSAANYSEFILLRNRYIAEPENDDLAASLVHLLRAELENAEAMLELVASDSRIGYEASIGYFYMPVEIVEKIYGLKLAIQRLTKVQT